MIPMPAEGPSRECKGVEIDLFDFSEIWAEENRLSARHVLKMRGAESWDREFIISPVLADKLGGSPFDIQGVVFKKKQRGIAGARPVVIRRPIDNKIEIDALVLCYDCADVVQLPGQHQIVVKYKFMSQGCLGVLPQSAYNAHNNNNNNQAACSVCQSALKSLKNEPSIEEL